MIPVYFMMGMLALGAIGCVLLGVMLQRISVMQKQTDGILEKLEAQARKEGHDAAERGEP